MLRLTIATAVMLAAMLPANAQIVPPAQYDHPFRGTLTIIEMESPMEIHQVCQDVSIYACALHDHPSTWCKIYTLKSLAKNKWLLRHEQAHCNGWPGDHAGGTDWPKNMTPAELKEADAMHRIQHAEKAKVTEFIEGLAAAFAGYKRADEAKMQKPVEKVETVSTKVGTAATIWEKGCPLSNWWDARECK